MSFKLTQFYIPVFQMSENEVKDENKETMEEEYEGATIQGPNEVKDENKETMMEEDQRATMQGPPRFLDYPPPPFR